MKEYREISNDCDLELCLAACSCDGYDIVQQLRKVDRQSSRFAACLCGARRARGKPTGGWSVVIDDAVRAPLFDPLNTKSFLKQEMQKNEEFSITGNPEGSPMNG